jgi:hypothetical protein
MAKVDISSIIDGLQKVLDGAEKMLPIAQKIGGPLVANVATTAIAGVAIAQNILARVEDGKAALSEKDETKLRDMLSKLQAANDKLAEAVAEEG